MEVSDLGPVHKNENCALLSITNLKSPFQRNTGKGSEFQNCFEFGSSIRYKGASAKSLFQGGWFMSFKKALDNLKFDSRMIESNIASGVLTKEELAKHIASLPDLEDQSARVSIGEDEDDFDTEEEDEDSTH